MNDKSTIGIAIFVKTIKLSPVKSRLAKSVGVTNAQLIYRYLLEITKSVLKEFDSKYNNIKVYYAVNEKEALNDEIWNDFETFWQGEGTLGDKLYNVQNFILDRHKSVIMVGSDAPFLNTTYFEEALIHLSKDPDNMILGPSTDGGFYLYAASKKQELHKWQDIPYSSTITLRELEKSFSHSLNPFYLEQNFDIDEFEDLIKAHGLIKNQSLIHKLFKTFIEENILEKVDENIV